MANMVSLYVADVSNVEMSVSELELHTGETFALSARVIPDYAVRCFHGEDGDETVARVDESGNVTAVAPGSCEIEARSANGRADYCRITVS